MPTLGIMRINILKILWLSDRMIMGLNKFLTQTEVAWVLVFNRGHTSIWPSKLLYYLSTHHRQGTWADLQTNRSFLQDLFLCVGPLLLHIKWQAKRLLYSWYYWYQSSWYYWYQLEFCHYNQWIEEQPLSKLVGDNSNLL